MPNHCTNELTINKSARNLILNKDGVVDFNILLPMPESLNVTSGTITNLAIATYECKVNRNYLPIMKLMIEHNVQCSPEEYMAQIECDYNKEKSRGTYEEGYMKRVHSLCSLGKIYVENEEKYGCHTWYDWCCKNWGTKWNAYDCRVKEVGDNLVIWFTTAWCPPEAWCRELATKVDSFNLNWDEEGGYYGNICGDHGEVSSLSDLHIWDDIKEED